MNTSSKQDCLIKVTYCSTAFENGRRNNYEYTTQVKVAPNSSVREVAIKVVKLSFGKMPNWLEKIDKNQPISIFLKNRSPEEKRAAPYGIGYDLGRNGSVKFLNGYEPLEHDWSYGRIVAMREARYISGDINHIIVETPDGLGGPGGVDLSKVIQGALQFIGILANIEGVLQLGERIAGWIRYRRIIKRCKDNGLYSLKQIRLFIEMNKTWKTNKVARALSVDQKTAAMILAKLGYVEKNGEWTFDNESIESLKLRKKWLLQEKKEEKIISEAIENGFKAKDKIE